VDEISWLEKLKYKFFNIFPYPDTPFVKIEDGSVYWIDFFDKRPRQISVGKNGRHCGLIKLLWNNNTLEIWDIILFEKHRSKGLGTGLLIWLISYARQENMQEIWGLVVPENEQDFDRTMAWYLHHGFQRESPSKNSISMKL